MVKTNTDKITRTQSALIARLIKTADGHYAERMHALATLRRDGFSNAAISRIVIRQRIKSTHPNWTPEVIDAEAARTKSPYREGFTVGNVGFYVAAYLWAVEIGAIESGDELGNRDAHAAYRLHNRFISVRDAVAARVRDGESIADAFSAETAGKDGDAGQPTRRKTPVETLIAAVERGNKLELSQSDARKVQRELDKLAKKVNRILSETPKESARKSSSRKRVTALAK